MIGIFFTLFTNTLDFWILRKYLQCFIHKRKFSHYQRVILFVSCVLLLSAANFYGNPNVNLVIQLCNNLFIQLFILIFLFISCDNAYPIHRTRLCFGTYRLPSDTQAWGLYFSRDVILYFCVYMRNNTLPAGTGNLS